jgi:hypothetical protein
VSVYKLIVLKKVVIPAKAGIQSFQDLLDAGSSLPARSRFGIGRSGMTE